MNKYYFYVITRDCQVFHSGYCTNVQKTVEKYKALPFMNLSHKNSLVYLSEQRSKDDAYIELNLFLLLTKDEKIAMIEEFNKDWVELVPGVNITL